MSDFSKTAFGIIRDMIGAGWTLHIRASRSDGAEVTFARKVRNRYGEFIRFGAGKDVAEAARAAKADLKEGDK